MRAASWLSDGGLELDGVRSGLGACMEACKDCGGGGLDMTTRNKSRRLETSDQLGKYPAIALRSTIKAVS